MYITASFSSFGFFVLARFLLSRTRSLLKVGLASGESCWFAVSFTSPEWAESGEGLKFFLRTSPTSSRQKKGEKEKHFS